MKNFFPLLLSLATFHATGQTNPVITSWWINADSTMVEGVLAGVSRVDYTTTNVYVSTNGIPEYYVSGMSVNNASAQNWVFRLPLIPQEQAGTKTAMPMGGPVGVLVDGSAIFGPLDAMTWNNGGVWHRIAYFFEGTDFDSTYGHSTPGPGNVYHHHVDAIVLHTFNNQAHSPIIGFAFDGFPIYGPFGYVNTDGSGGIKLMAPGYQLRGISDRQTLPDGTVNPGPAIGGMYPIGCFQEDYEYVHGSGDLDSCNGRFTVTPEYPSGTYAYFTTIDNTLDPLYPYFLGLCYHGISDNSNLGPNGGHNTVPGSAIQYIPDTVTAVNQIASSIGVQLTPNPADDWLRLPRNAGNDAIVEIYHSNGRIAREILLSAEQERIDVSSLSPGIYFVTIKGEKFAPLAGKFVKR